MIVVKPFKVLDNQAALTTNIAIPDTDAGEVEWTAGTYSTGERRIKSSTRLVYEVVASPSTSDDPEDGINADPPTWGVVGYVNRWRMFDNVIGAVSTRNTPIDITITPNQLVNSVSVFGMVGVTSVIVTIADPTAGVVYDKTFDLRDSASIDGWYSYFFEPIIKSPQFTALDLPPYSQASLRLQFIGSVSVSVGEVVTGKQIELGVGLYGSSVQLLDFSRKERDAFGNFVIVPRRTAKLVDFNVSIPTARVGYVFNTLQTLTTEPCVWVTDTDRDDALAVFGYYRDTQLSVEYPSYSSATIQIEGLT